MASPHDPRPSPPEVLFRWVAEDHPGDRWAALLTRAWQPYRRWFVRQGIDARPSLLAGRAKLVEHMPELVPTWERLIDLAGAILHDPKEIDLAARLLTLWNPPRFLAGCSQAVWLDGTPTLLRNYDFSPLACEATVVRSRWTGTGVVASSDCLWGVLDGVNEHGLSVALAFGGPRDVADGFGITLILRYVLEVCSTVDEAVSVLRRVPSHMAYNVTVLDRSGAHSVAYLGPGREPRFSSELVCTNHQPGRASSRYSQATRSVHRKRQLLKHLRDEKASLEALTEAFLEPPLYVTDYDRGYGTLYTVAYRPELGEADFRWPDGRVLQTLDAYQERELVAVLGGEPARSR